ITTPVTLTSYNLATGQKNWNTGFEAGGLSHLTFTDGLLLFAGHTLSDDKYKLYAWDAATGMQKYVVDLPNLGGSPLTPTVARNANNQLVAYVGSFKVSAVALGANSGTVMWTASGAGLGGFSIPTIAGDSIILIGPADNYA